MAVSDAHKRASTKYNKSRDNIMIRPDKAEGQAIREAAADAGMSVQAFILKAVREAMEKEKFLTGKAAPLSECLEEEEVSL